MQKTTPQQNYPNLPLLQQSDKPNIPAQSKEEGYNNARVSNEQQCNPLHSPSISQQYGTPHNNSQIPEVKSRSQYQQQQQYQSYNIDGSSSSLQVELFPQNKSTSSQMPTTNNPLINTTLLMSTQKLSFSMPLLKKDRQKKYCQKQVVKAILKRKKQLTQHIAKFFLNELIQDEPIEEKNLNGLIQELIQKGLGSIQYILASDQGNVLRGYVHQGKIKINVFLLEQNYDHIDRKIIVAYNFLVLVRLLATYVLGNLDLQFQIDNDEYDVATMFRGGKDIGYSFQYYIREGEQFECASVSDYDMMQSDKIQFESLGKHNQDHKCLAFGKLSGHDLCLLKIHPERKQQLDNFIQQQQNPPTPTQYSPEKRKIYTGLVKKPSHQHTQLEIQKRERYIITQGKKLPTKRDPRKKKPISSNQAMQNDGMSESEKQSQSQIQKNQFEDMRAFDGQL